MSHKPDFPRVAFHFNSKGKLESSESTFRAVSDMLANNDNKITDLIVLSHGWNENEGSATDLYNLLLGQIQAAMQDTTLCADRSFGVLEVFWLSQFRFFWEPRSASGAAASLGASDSMQEVVNQLSGFFEDDTYKQKKLQEACETVDDLVEGDSEAATRFIQSFNELLKTDQKSALEPMDDWLENIDPDEGEQLLKQLQLMPIGVSNRQYGNAASIYGEEEYDGFESSVAAMSGLGLGGLKNGAKRLLTLLTYNKMRERANIVGSIGLNDALHQLKQYSGLKLHLIGHSFGSLLVTSAVLGPDRQRPLSIDSLTLLQAAFSQYCFASRYDGNLDGVFKPVLKQVNGPILISHTRNDMAVGAAYALASKLTGDVASGATEAIEQAINGIAGSDGFYGGLGFNGARMTPESSDDFCLSEGVSVFNFKPKIVYNLKADTLIMGHSKLDHIEIAQAILSAIAAT